MAIVIDKVVLNFGTIPATIFTTSYEDCLLVKDNQTTFMKTNWYICNILKHFPIFGQLNSFLITVSICYLKDCIVIQLVNTVNGNEYILDQV